MQINELEILDKVWLITKDSNISVETASEQLSILKSIDWNSLEIDNCVKEIPKKIMVKLTTIISDKIEDEIKTITIENESLIKKYEENNLIIEKLNQSLKELFNIEKEEIINSTEETETEKEIITVEKSLWTKFKDYFFDRN